MLYIHLDDAVEAIPVHFSNGIWGLLATGLFSSPRFTTLVYGHDQHVGFFYEIGRGTFDCILLRNQFYAILLIINFAAFTMIPFFLFLNYFRYYTFCQSVLSKILKMMASQIKVITNQQLIVCSI